MTVKTFLFQINAVLLILVFSKILSGTYFFQGLERAINFKFKVVLHTCMGYNLRHVNRFLIKTLVITNANMWHWHINGQKMLLRLFTAELYRSVHIHSEEKSWSV